MHINDIEDYHAKSKVGWASIGQVEMFDYFIERMSILDRTLNNNTNGDLYDYIAFSNGNNWNKIPKLSVFYDYVREGKYFYQFYLNEGDKVALVDKNNNAYIIDIEGARFFDLEYEETPSSFLGSISLSLLKLCNLYNCLASEGKYYSYSFIESVYKSDGTLLYKNNNSFVNKLNKNETIVL